MNRSNKVIRWTMLIIWMSIIFFMSNQVADVSNHQSGLVIKIFDFIGIDLNGFFGELANFLVRKGAHFTEYLILYMLAYRVIRLYKNQNEALIWGIVFVIVYATTDEFHQSFVPGRAMMIRDILIDTTGAVFGYALLSAKKILKRRVIEKRAN